MVAKSCITKRMVEILKMVVSSKIMHLSGISHYKPSMLGYPHDELETPKQWDKPPLNWSDFFHPPSGPGCRHLARLRLEWSYVMFSAPLLLLARWTGGIACSWPYILRKLGKGCQASERDCVTSVTFENTLYLDET